MQKADLSSLEEKIGYTFRDKQLLAACFTHSSYAKTHGTQSNERLEFLGDALIGFLVAEELYRGSDDAEGEMTKRRIAIVSRRPLEEAVRAMGIGYAFFSGGENNLGKKSVSSLFEGIAAGIYLDGGMQAARAFVREKLMPYAGNFDDFKSRLNELFPHAVQYEECSRSGQDHAPCFTVRVTASGKSALGSGASKEQAEQSAARALLEHLGATRGE